MKTLSISCYKKKIPWTVLGLVFTLFLGICSLILSYQLPLLERHSTGGKKKRLFGCVVVLGDVCPQNCVFTVCRCCKKRFNLLFFPRLGRGYVHMNMSGVVHSFKFGTKGQRGQLIYDGTSVQGTGTICLLGYNGVNVLTVTEVMFSEDVLFLSETELWY